MTVYRSKRTNYVHWLCLCPTERSCGVLERTWELGDESLILHRDTPGPILSSCPAFSLVSLHYCLLGAHSVQSCLHITKSSSVRYLTSFLLIEIWSWHWISHFAFLISDSSFIRCRLWEQMAPIIPSGLMMSSVRVSICKIYSFLNFDFGGCRC